MKEIARTLVKRGILVNDVEQPLPDAWRVEVERDSGERLAQVFDFDPTDDQVIEAFGPEPVKRPVRSSNLVERIEALAELSAHWQALDFAATKAAADATFTAQERNRLATARDAVRDKIKALV